MAWCIDILLCKFYIKIVFCFYDNCNSKDIMYIILWLSPHPWVVLVNGYMEINTWMSEWMTKSIVTDKGFCLKTSMQGSLQIISADSNLIEQLMIRCST